MIILEREVNWKAVLYGLENQLKIPGMVYFVISVEVFSGKFKLECVENRNKYLMNGYISAFFEKPEVDARKGKTTHTFTKLAQMIETSSQRESEESEDDGQYSIEYTGDGSVSPPVPVGGDGGPEGSSEYPNMKPSPQELSKQGSVEDLGAPEKRPIQKQFSIDEKLLKQNLNKKLKSNEEFDGFFDNIEDVVFCYDEKKSEGNEPGEPKEEEPAQERRSGRAGATPEPGQADSPAKPKKKQGGEGQGERQGERLKLWANQSIKFGQKKAQKQLQRGSSRKSVGVELMRLKKEKFYRKKFPLALHGKTEQAVKEASGISDVIFVSRDGTIACGFTLRAMVALAEHALFN